MNPDPVQTVQALYEAIRERDLVKISSLLSPDIEIVQSEELPWGGVYGGYEGVQQFFGRLGAHINSTLSFERFLRSGDHVTAIGWTRGTVNATGARYDVPIAHIWKVRDGKAVQARFFIDHPTMFEALNQGRAE